MKRKSTTKHSEEFLHPVQIGGVSAQALADEFQRISGQKIPYTVVCRWLTDKNRVEPRLGAGLVLRRAFENLKRKKTP